MNFSSQFKTHIMNNVQTSPHIKVGQGNLVRSKNGQKKKKRQAKELEIAHPQC
jgi:hypothetical protein